MGSQEARQAVGGGTRAVSGSQAVECLSVAPVLQADGSSEVGVERDPLMVGEHVLLNGVVVNQAAGQVRLLLATGLSNLVVLAGPRRRGLSIPYSASHPSPSGMSKL